MKITAIIYKALIETVLEVMKEFTIIEIRSFYIITLDGREILMISSCPKILNCQLTCMIGNPSPYKKLDMQQELVLSKESPIKFAEEEVKQVQALVGKNNKNKDKINYIPIKDLNTASGEDWFIKGRVTKKGKKIVYATGFMLKIELIDKEGTQIEGTFYKDSCDKFIDKIEEGKIYVIGKGQIANANKKFTSIQNDYRIIFTEHSHVQEYVSMKDEVESKQSHQSEHFQRFKFNFLKISDVLSCIHNLKQIDVIGINISKDPKRDDIEVKFDYGKNNVKGRLILEIVDNSNESINVTLWGELSNLEFNEGDIVIINGGRISNYGGKSINCGSEHCKIIINPSREVVSDLENYINVDKINLVAKTKQQIQSQEQAVRAEGMSKLRDESQTFIVNLLEELNCSFEGTFNEGCETFLNPQGIFCLQGNITKFVQPSDSIAYLGCPICFKKVTDNRLTGFYCTNCLKIIKEKHHYFIHAIFQDFTGKVLIGFSREQAEQLMNNIDASTYMTKIRKTFRQECDFEGWLNENVYFKTFKILVKAKSEQFKGVNRLRFYALDIDYISKDSEKANFRDENRLLLNQLKQSVNNSSNGDDSQ
eukprot:403331791